MLTLPIGKIKRRRVRIIRVLGGEAAVRRSDAGFSLVEVMVVTALIGLAASVVVLSLPPSSSQQQNFSADMAARLNQARSEAILGAQSLGLEMSRTHYRFLSFKAGRWHTNPETQNGYSVPDGLHLALLKSGVPVTLPQSLSGEAARPHLLFQPDGTLAPTDIALEGHTGVQSYISQGPDGRFQTLTESAYERLRAGTLTAEGIR